MTVTLTSLLKGNGFYWLVFQMPHWGKLSFSSLWNNLVMSLLAAAFIRLELMSLLGETPSSPGNNLYIWITFPCVFGLQTWEWPLFYYWNFWVNPGGEGWPFQLLNLPYFQLICSNCFYEYCLWILFPLLSLGLELSNEKRDAGMDGFHTVLISFLMLVQRLSKIIHCSEMPLGGLESHIRELAREALLSQEKIRIITLGVGCCPKTGLHYQGTGSV